MNYLSRMVIFLMVFSFVAPLQAKLSISLVHNKGEVYIKSSGKKRKAKKGLLLSERDEIYTGKSSLAIVKIETKEARQTLKVEPNSVLLLEKIGYKNQSSRLKKGGVFLYLKSKIRDHKSNPKVMLNAKSIAMGVRGTEFYASFGPKGHRDDFWMCVNEGKVKVTSKSSKKGVLVKEGEGIQITKGDRISKPRPYEWTKKLNWNKDPKKGKLFNKANLNGAYEDLLDQDYD